MENGDFSRANYTERFFTQNAMASENQNFKPIFDLTMKGNTFEQFNFLKDYVTEGDNSTTRNQSMIAQVPQLGLQNYGMIVDIDGGFENGKLIFSQNVIRDTLFYFKVEKTYELGLKGNFTLVNHCEDIAEVQPYYQFPLWDSMSSSYAQFAHLLSIKDFKGAQIFITDNQFQNLSLPSSLVYLNETYNSSESSIVLSGNSFYIIQPYTGTGIMDIRRVYSHDYYGSITAILENGIKQLSTEIVYEIQSIFKWLSAFGGNILVSDNIFTDIVGCPAVHTSLIHLSVQDKYGTFGVGSEYKALTKFDMPSQDQTTMIKLLDLMYENANDQKSKFLPFITKSDTKYTIYTSQKSYTLNNQSSQFKGNTYQHLSIGVATDKLYMTKMFRGSLIKLNHIFKTEFQQETYKSVGSFTFEHLQYVIRKIKNEDTFLEAKEPLRYSKSEMNTYYGQIPGGNTAFTKQTIFNKYLSTSLIDGYCVGEIRFIEFNNFTNIWMLNQGSMFVKATGVDEMSESGLILYTTYLFSSLQIGGKASPQQALGNIFLQNFTGPFNRMNFLREPFKRWNPSVWSGDLIMEEDLVYGNGSPLFNIQDDTNSIDSLIVSNLQLRYIYTRVDKTSTSDLQFPMIISSLKGSTSADSTSQVNSLVIENVHMTDITYEGGSSYFVVYGKDTTLRNFTALNIGTFHLPSEPEYSHFDPSMFQSTSLAPFPLFDCYFYGSTDSSYGNNLTATAITVRNAQNFNGLPVFQTKVLSAPTGSQRNQFVLKESKFAQIQSDKVAASVMYEQSNNEGSLDVYVKDSTFTQLYAINGLVASQGSLASVTFEDCTFTENEGEQARLFYITSNNFGAFYMNNCQISHNPEILSDVMLKVLEEDPGNFAYGTSMIKVSKSTNVIIDNTVVSDIHYVDSAAFIDIADKSIVVMRSVTVSGLSAYQAAVFAITGYSALSVQDSTFTENLAVKNGVFSVGDYSSISITDSTFKENQAVYQGVFKVSGESQISVTGSTFQENIAEKQNSIGQLIQVGAGSLFSQTTFEHNQAFYSESSTGAKGLEVLSCENLLSFTDCTFKDNTAVQTTANLYLNRGQKVVFNYCNFISTAEASLGSQLKGSYIHLIAESSVTIQNSNFLSGHAMIGGALYILGDSSAVIKGSKFTDNVAEKRGGAICAESFTRLTIDDQCTFYNNEAQNETGDAIFALSSMYTVSVAKTAFSRTKASNFITFQDIDNVIMNDVSMKLSSGTADAMNKTSGIIIQDVKNLIIKNSQFENLVGNAEQGGGALQIIETANSKSDTNSFLISNCVFEGCSNINGGAIALIDAAHVKINQNTKFIENKAAKSGGAIYFKCSDYGKNFNKCKLTINSSQFIKNKAGIEGGSIKWNFYEPIMDGVQNINNTAGVYGGDIASVAKKLIRIDSSELKATNFPDYKMRSLRRLDTTVDNSSGTEIDNVQSGGQINIYFALIDKYGSVIRTDNTSKLFISPEQDESSSVKSLLETTTQVNCENGNFVVENLIFVGEPNSTQKLQFSTDGINQNIPDNSANVTTNTSSTTIEAATSNKTAASDFVIVLSLRQCLEGEEMLQSGKCQNCSAGTYLLEAPIKTTLCKECVDADKGECLGGNLLYPKAGYWRSSKYSENMIGCRNDEACLGRNPPYDNPLGACGEGYQGILCSDCEVGYSRTGSSYKCSKCPSTDTNVLRLLGLFVLLIVGLVMLIRSNLQSASKEKNYMTVFFRIIMNHFQLLTLTASFDLEWPSQLQSFFSAAKPVSEVSTQFLSVDCFLDQRKSNLNQGMLSTLFDPDQNYIFRIFFQKLIILGFSPFMVVVASFIVWNCIFSYHDWKNKNSIANPLVDDSARVAILPEDTNGASLTTHAPVLVKKETFGASMKQSFTVKKEQDLFAEKIKKDKKQGRIIATIIIVLFLVHPTITATMFNAFSCQNIDGTERLYEDLQVICYQSSHKIIAYSVGLPSLFIWGLGIPTYGLILVYRNRKELAKFEIKEKYGFLYNGYRNPQAYFWEFIIMYRKIVIIFIQVFLAQSGKIVQALAILLFLILCLSATAVKQPFANLPLNSLESISLMSSAITVYCGLFYIADAQFKADSDFSMSDNSKLFLFSAIVASHSIFLSYWSYHFVQEMRQVIRKRLPTLYVSFFLCCQQKKLDKELKVEQFRQKIAPFLAQYEKAMYYLELRKQMYNEGQIPLEDEKLRPLVLKIARFASKVEKNLVFSGAKDRKSVKINDIIENNDIKQQIKNLRVDKLGMSMQGGRGGAESMKMMDNLAETVYMGGGWSKAKGNDMIVIGDEDYANIPKKKDEFEDLENEEIKEEFFDDGDSSQFNRELNQSEVKGEFGFRQSITMFDRKRNTNPIHGEPEKGLKRQVKGRGSMPELETTFNKLDTSIAGLNQPQQSHRDWQEENESTDHDRSYSQQLETNRAFLTIGVDNLSQNKSLFAPKQLVRREDIYPQQFIDDSDGTVIGEGMQGSTSRKMTLDDFTTLDGGANRETNHADYLAVPHQARHNALFNLESDSHHQSQQHLEQHSYKNQHSNSSAMERHHASSARKLKMKMERHKREKRKYFNEQMAKGKISGNRIKKTIETQKTLDKQKLPDEGETIELEDFSDQDFSSHLSAEENEDTNNQATQAMDNTRQEENTLKFDPQSRNALFEQHVRESDSASSEVGDKGDPQLSSLVLNKMIEEVEQEFSQRD
ncbi:hypothetical protein FGO68_gene8013 [Halteria grandinella]|uniref:Uncharacterized protein n=1 Tax=Halteria grandinella TaxID=5974 RepID=A0A8J8TB97_HALGN|nr:hypothetical protein FGO68_gene8013 [Halteria grandinella]